MQSERWKQLAELVAREKDPAKLQELIREILRHLDSVEHLEDRLNALLDDKPGGIAPRYPPNAP